LLISQLKEGNTETDAAELLDELRFFARSILPRVIEIAKQLNKVSIFEVSEFNFGSLLNPLEKIGLHVEDLLASICVDDVPFEIVWMRGLTGFMSEIAHLYNFGLDVAVQYRYRLSLLRDKNKRIRPEAQYEMKEMLRHRPPLEEFITHLLTSVPAEELPIFSKVLAEETNKAIVRAYQAQVEFLQPVKDNKDIMESIRKWYSESLEFQKQIGELHQIIDNETLIAKNPPSLDQVGSMAQHLDELSYNIIRMADVFKNRAEGIRLLLSRIATH
jgi:hypothetical protein